MSGGALAATKLKKVVAILKKLKSFTKGQWDEFFKKVNTRIGKKGGELSNVGGSFASLGNKVSSLAPDALKKVEKLLKENQTIIRFDYGGRVSQTAEQFLKTVGDDFYDIVFKNGAYAKFDKQTGRMLYVDGDLHAFVRYTKGNDVSDLKALLTDRATKMRNVLGLNGVQTINLIDGTVVKTAKNKVTTFIGKTTETQVLKDLYGDFKHIKVGETNGSVNLLNRSDTNWNPVTWFEDYNQKWMQRAIDRRDDIYLASPLKGLDMTKDNILWSKKYGKSYYAKELETLIKYNSGKGYKPKNVSVTEWNEIINMINNLPD